MERSVPPDQSSDNRNRKRAAVAVLPLMFIGLFDLVLLLKYGLNPLWGFAILPPILFVSTFGWIYFSADHDS